MARQKLVHLHTGENRAPSASVLNYGEIAVQHNADNAALYIKTGENTVEKFISETGVQKLISASTEEFVALKSEVVTVSGELESLTDTALTGITVNNVSGTVENNVASVTVSTDNVKVGTAVQYGQDETLATTGATTTQALQALANKVYGIDGVISSSNHTHENKALLDTYTQTEANLADAVAKKHEHENKAVLDGITSEKVTAWDQAATDDHTHANKALLDTYTQTEANLSDAVAKKHEHANQAELDLIASGDKAKWDSAATALNDKVDKVEGKGLSTNDYTTAEKEKLESIAASAQTNVIESVKVNGTALSVTDKAVDILVAERSYW